MFVSVTAALLLAAPAAPADLPQDGKLYTLKAVHSGKALAPEVDGVGVVQAELKAGDVAQQWKFVKTGEFYRVVHGKSGKAVEVPENAEDATPLALSAAKDAGDRQLWTLTKGDKGFTLKSKATGKVWDIEGVSGDDGAKLIQYPAKEGDDAANQTFELVPAEAK